MAEQSSVEWVADLPQSWRSAPKDEPDELRQLPIELIDPNPNQPRRNLDSDGLLALSESIRVRGLIQPILVRPLASGRYELIAGERRWRAAQLAGLETVLGLVRGHDDAASLELALIENMAREDLNPVDQARACAALVEELGLTREEVGLRVGRSRVAVSNLIRLLDLPDEALHLLEQGTSPRGMAGRCCERRRTRLAAPSPGRPSLPDGRYASSRPKRGRRLRRRIRDRLARRRSSIIPIARQRPSRSPTLSPGSSVPMSRFAPPEWLAPADLRDGRRRARTGPPPAGSQPRLRSGVRPCACGLAVIATVF